MAGYRELRTEGIEVVGRIISVSISKIANLNLLEWAAL